MLCQALSYSAYLVAIALETHAQADHVGKFAAGILIARIPILGFQAVQAALLPKLARLAGEGRDDEFRKALRQLVMIVLAVGIVGVIGSFTVGHVAGKVLFGTRFTLDNRDLGLLAVGSGAFIFALTLAQALIAPAELRGVGAVVAGRGGRLRRSASSTRTTSSCAPSSASRSARSAPRLAMLVCLAVRTAIGRTDGTMERLTTGLEHRAARAC